MHDFRNSDFPDGGGDAEHVDIWQPYGVPGGLSDHNVFECNWAADNVEHNSHFNQIRDETRPRSGEKQFVIRGNVALRMGSYACQFGAIDMCTSTTTRSWTVLLEAGRQESLGHHRL